QGRVAGRRQGWRRRDLGRLSPVELWDTRQSADRWGCVFRPGAAWLRYALLQGRFVMRHSGLLGHPVSPASGHSKFLTSLAMAILVWIFFATPASSQNKPVVLKGGKLLTVSHGTIDNGILVIENGKIAAIGKSGAVRIPAGAQVIDVSGMTVFPGMIDY